MDEVGIDRQGILDRLLGDPPAVNIANWSTHESCYRLIARLASPGCRTLETGCGLSTALFAALGTQHYCVTPDLVEVELLQRYLDKYGIAADDVTFEVAPSQLALPRLDLQLDLVFIDGGHAFPLPILDWFYACRRLRPGGTVIVDDRQLAAVDVLVQFLDRDPRWEQIERTAKWAAFRRLSDWDLGEGHWDQPFHAIEASSAGALARTAIIRVGRRLRRLARERPAGLR